MKTIGVDIRVLGTGRISGIEEYTEQVVSHMIARGGDVAWKLFYSGRTPLVWREWMRAPQVQVIETRSSNRLLWLSTRALGTPKLDELVGGADVFFFPHFLLGALSPACKRVMTWHDLSYERMPYLLSPYRRIWHALQMQPRRQAKIADHHIAVSSATARDLEVLYQIPQHRCTVIPSGIDSHLRRASDVAVQEWRARRAITAPFILALGTREPRKNLPALVRAWDITRKDPSCGGLQLVLAGPRGWMERDLHRAVAATSAPSDVHFIEHIDRSECALLLSAASLLAYPSLMEGFGFPPLEAMACGTPVVASATSSLFETVGDAGVLVDPYRVDALARALIAVHADADLRQRLVARGYEHAHEYSWERAAEATRSVLLSVLS